MDRRTKIAAILSAGLCFFATVRDARAEDSPSAPARWYGWEYAAADVAGASLLVYARASSTLPLVNDPLLTRDERHVPFVAPMSGAEMIGTGLYFGGAPVAHLANGHPMNALASLAIRTLPVIVVQWTEPTGEIIGFFVRDGHGQRASCHGDGICMDLSAGSHANDGMSVGADIGLFGGAAAAMLVDQVALSNGSIGARPKKNAGSELAPNLWIGKNSAYAGVGGSF